MTNKLKVNRFPVDSMKANRIILIVGKRGTGKSTLLKDILYHLRKSVDTGFAMSPTADTVAMFEDCFPYSHIYDEYSLDAVKSIMECAAALKEQGKTRKLVLAIDDCMFDKGIMKTKEMREIHMNGRHLNLCFVNSVQYVMDLGPDLRTQIDYVFALKENVIANRQRLHKYFFGVFEKYDQFSAVMDKCTDNHECLVLDNTQPTNKIEDSIFYYKANNNIGRFRIGRSIYYKLDFFYRIPKENKSAMFGNSQRSKVKLPERVVTKQKISRIEKEDGKDEDAEQ
jgi:hypothetical protein